MIELATVEAASAGADYTGELFVLGGIALTAILGILGNVLVKRFREPTRIETMWERLDAMQKMIYGDDPGDGKPRTVGLLERMERSERRDATKGRIIRSLSRQWQGEPPRLNPDDLAELDEDTLPLDHLWRVKP